ncbi:MAG: addiction module antidote protein, HigA family [Spirochaetaceae bacterium]|nr:MAG: addiction module antidote protein, HigA family [Spirochaetaceae bacterium]
MATAMNEFQPDYAVHPGEYLEEVLEARQLSKSEFADRCGLSAKTVSQIINGHNTFSSEVALQFETVLGISAGIWMNLVASYQLHMAREQEESRLKSWGEWAAQFPLADLRKHGVIGRRDAKGDWVRSLLSFFQVSTPQAWEQMYGRPAAAYRKSQSLAVSRFSLATWLRLAEEQAARAITEPYDAGRLRTAIDEIRTLTREEPEVFAPRVRQLCASAGVALVFVPDVKGARVSGATRWLSPTKAMVAQSLRHKSDDHFWFTLLHELAHVLLHAKKEVFVDEPGADESQAEQEANRFARDHLVPRKRYADFVSRGSFYPDEIAEFAEELQVAPGVVVGMLQYDGELRHEWGDKLKRRFELAPGT